MVSDREILARYNISYFCQKLAFLTLLKTNFLGFFFLFFFRGGGGCLT